LYYYIHWKNVFHKVFAQYLETEFSYLRLV